MGLSIDNIDFMSISNIFTQSEESWLEPVSSTPATAIDGGPRQPHRGGRAHDRHAARVGGPEEGGWVIIFDVCSKT